MNWRGFYGRHWIEGGILFLDPPRVYPDWYLAEEQYEYWLAGVLKNRIAMFDDPTTFWGRNRYQLETLALRMKFSEKDHYLFPSDPLIAMPEPYLIVHTLKRKALNKLRRKFLKLKRQGKLW